MYYKDIHTYFVKRYTFIFIIRNPISVSNSLFNRDGITSDRAIAIWMIYNHALNSKNSELKAIINFDLIEKYYLDYSKR